MSHDAPLVIGAYEQIPSMRECGDSIAEATTWIIDQRNFLRKCMYASISLSLSFSLGEMRDRQVLNFPFSVLLLAETRVEDFSSQTATFLSVSSIFSFSFFFFLNRLFYVASTSWVIGDIRRRDFFYSCRSWMGCCSRLDDVPPLGCLLGGVIKCNKVTNAISL